MLIKCCCNFDTSLRPKQGVRLEGRLAGIHIEVALRSIYCKMLILLPVKLLQGLWSEALTAYLRGYGSAITFPPLFTNFPIKMCRQERGKLGRGEHWDKCILWSIISKAEILLDIRKESVSFYNLGKQQFYAVIFLLFKHCFCSLRVNSHHCAQLWYCAHTSRFSRALNSKLNSVNWKREEE